MEVAAARLLQPHLRRRRLSVGVVVDVEHTSATPEGVRVTATARYLGREGKLHLFEVVARDVGGEIGRARIGERWETGDRLAAGAQRRNPHGDPSARCSTARLR